MRTRGLVSRTDGFLTGAIRDAKLSRRLSFFLQLIELVVHGLEADPELGGGRGLVAAISLRSENQLLT